tara:strand:- start:286 stop:1218 length:933 start_codon:yes stop_codon:yes gene_type:complete
MTNEPYLATTDQDKDAIIALHLLCFSTGLPELQVVLDDKRCFAFLGEGGVGGYIVCRIQDKESELLWVGVIPEHRGEGCGRSLISAALNESRVRGAEIMSLYVAEDNDSAIHLYKSLGFINAGRREGFYADMTDANIMRASLIKNENQENESQKDEPYLATDQDRDAITALHSICFNSLEWAKLQVALDDKNCFTFLAGCDEDGQPYGFAATRIQDKVAYGLWSGIRPEQRGKGRYRNLMLAALNESRVRGAEIYDSYIAEDTPMAAKTLRLHKKLGFVTVDSIPDFAMQGGERHEFTNHHVIVSLITGK